MSKKKAVEVNKSQEIRDYKRANPTLKPKQIAIDLGKKGIDVSPGFVSTILSVSKRKPQPGKRGRPKGSTNAKTARELGRALRSPVSMTDGSLDVDSLLRMKMTVEEIGGIENAKTALATLERLLD